MPEEPGPFGDRPQDHADRRGDEGVAEDGPEAREGDAEAVAHRRIAAAQPDQRGADQGRVAEEDDEVLHDVEEEAEHVAERGYARFAQGRRVEEARQEHRHEEGDEHEHRQHARDDREDHELLVGAQDLGAGLDQLPAPGQSIEHRRLLLAQASRALRL